MSDAVQNTAAEVMANADENESFSSAEFDNEHNNGLKPKDKLYCYTISVLEQQVNFLQEEIAFLRDQLKEKDALHKMTVATLAVGFQHPAPEKAATGRDWDSSLIKTHGGDGGYGDTGQAGWTNVPYKRGGKYNGDSFKTHQQRIPNKNNLTCTAGRYQTLPVEPCKEVLVDTDTHKPTPVKRNNRSRSPKQQSRIKSPKHRSKSPSPTIRPGNEPYNRAHVNKVAIISDSMMGGIKEKALNEAIHDIEANVEKHPGARSNQIKYYSALMIDEMQPNSIVIHAGTNDLWNNRNKQKRGLDDGEIVENIIKTGCIAREKKVTNILVSSVIVRRGMYYERRRNNINRMLREQCLKEGFQFIDNSNIMLDHIGRDGIHLLPTGTDILFKNVVDNLSIPIFNDSNFSFY